MSGSVDPQSMVHRRRRVMRMKNGGRRLESMERDEWAPRAKFDKRLASLTRRCRGSNAGSLAYASRAMLVQWKDEGLVGSGCIQTSDCFCNGQRGSPKARASSIGGVIKGAAVGEGSRDGGNGEKQGPWMCGQERPEAEGLERRYVPVIFARMRFRFLWVKRHSDGQGMEVARETQGGEERNRGL